MQARRYSVDGIVYRDGEASAEVSHWSQISHVGFTDDAGHEVTGRVFAQEHITRAGLPSVTQSLKAGRYDSWRS